MKTYNAKIKDGKLIIKTPKLWQDKLQLLEGKDVLISIEKFRKRRTDAQNRALHLWFTQLADALNLAGYDMKKVIRPDVDISWSPISVKEYLWRPIQKEFLKKKSTTKLKSDEIDQVYEIVNRIIAERTGVHIPFPSLETLFNQQ